MSEKFQLALSTVGLLLTVVMTHGQGTNDSSGAGHDVAVNRHERTAPAVDTNAHSFRIFLPGEDVFSRTPEVEERIQSYFKSKPGEIPLAKDPLISDRDIETYDWKTHTLTVDPSVDRRIRQPLVWGTPFIVVADGEPIYVGAFYSLFSSQSCPVPVILTDHVLRGGTNRLVINRSYAGPKPDPSAVDPRSDARIKNSLQALGKLKE